MQTNWACLSGVWVWVTMCSSGRLVGFPLGLASRPWGAVIEGSMAPEAWHALVNNGALAAFAVFVMWGFWRIMARGGVKAWELGERYVASTEALHETLKEADSQQKALCQSHQTTLTVLAESVDENTIIQREQCCHLKELVDLHTSPGAAVAHSMHQTDSLHGDMKRMKRAAVRACEMCRTIANNEFPNSAAKIDEHCTEIEKLIRDSGPIDVEGLSN